MATGIALKKAHKWGINRKSVLAPFTLIPNDPIYIVKGKMKGRKARLKKVRQMVANVAATGNGDPVATIRKVKSWANEVGGSKKLKALVDVLSE